ncbi:MAG: AGE family epimerase/isomerase [Candidatus Latescibacteria bacterium]|nr:AGE family epimerase/isomerase [Candidatus Latescibacterota bacterium]
MKRRAFFGVSAGTAAALTGTNGCNVKKIEHESQKISVGNPGGLSLEELRDRYRHDLFDDFLPFLDTYVIDHEYGGFMCNTDRSGKNITTNKSSWYEGRGIWVYSFLYNKVEPDPKYLEVARMSVEFILKHRPSGDKLWPGSYSKEGKMLTETGDIYGGLFIANGLSEYSKAVKDDSYWDIAKDILIRHLRLYDSPDYNYQVTYYMTDPPPLKGPRVLGHWMVLLRLVTQMLEFKSDPEIEIIADRCVDAILNYHFNPAYGLMNEAINHDMSRAGGGYEQFSYTGHAIETLWMVLFEAERRKDRALYDRAAEMLKRHVEISWDDVYGGAFRCLDHVDNNTWKVDKVLWLQEEVLIGTLFMIEHTGDPWAKEWFDKMYAYVTDKFPLKQYGYPLWILGADRKVTFVEEYGRVGNFHHPRHLMLNLLSVERMIKRKGMVSDLFI